MRLAGQEKMGYYPTPEPVAVQIGRLLTGNQAGPIRALDPCCGEGTALRLAIDTLNIPVETYGVELDGHRARAAREALTYVLHADVRNIRAGNQAFGLLWLNPPYDWDSPDDHTMPSERLERVFLQATMRYLQPGGVLAYLIPEQRLTIDIGKALAYRFERVQAWRFPAEHYQAYRQLVILGVKKQDPYRDDQVASRLAAIGHGLVTPPPLPETLDQPYRVPSAPATQRPLFQSTTVDPADLLEEVGRHGAAGVLLERITPLDSSAALRPLMPLRRGHLALILASGYLNNEMVEDPATGERLLVKGRVTKEVQRTETEEDDVTVITERERLKITVTALDLNTGAVHTIK
jgi:SAM-dependent methyltransferase